MVAGRKAKKAKAVKEAESSVQKPYPDDWAPFLAWYHHFYDQQMAFTLSPSWIRFFIGGNGTGKSLVVHWNALAYALGYHPHQKPDEQTYPNPPLKVRFLVPDFDKVSEVSLPKLQDPQTIIRPDGPLEVGPMLPPSMIKKGSRFTKDNRQIALKNGSVLSWVTNEQGWKAMRGAEFDILVMDEESELRVFDENKRGLRNAKGGGKIIAGLTPPYEEGCGPTWTKHEIVDRAANVGNDPSEINKDIEVFNACMADNPAITEEFIERFSQGKTKQQVQVQVYGNYPTWGDLVHPDFQDTYWDPKKVHGHLLPNDSPMPEAWEVDWVMAFDWHPSKAAAAVWGYIDDDKNFVIFDELDKDLADNVGDDIDELTDVFFGIEGKPHLKRRFRRWQDPSAKTEYKKVLRGWNAWDAFRKCGIVTSAGRNRDPEVGISIVNDYFRGNIKDHPRIFIFERCKYTRKYLKNHYWVRGADGRGKPDPQFSDYPICIRYILQEVGFKHYNKKHKIKWPLRSFEAEPREPYRFRKQAYA